MVKLIQKVNFIFFINKSTKACSEIIVTLTCGPNLLREKVAWHLFIVTAALCVGHCLP